MDAPKLAWPQAFERYWTMWNETDPTRVRDHLERAVSDDLVWADPNDFHTGRDALEANVIALRDRFPKASFVIVSDVQSHHGRYRYEWEMRFRTKVLQRGMDVATIDDDGLICRVDGFFGSLSTVT